ncbi:MAG: 7-carboxy-7-deazaguanine synthase [Holophagaceae bacterium]|nr:7-carboxy-7-deazaguanine synthase [Holophagaceae bacterium]
MARGKPKEVALYRIKEIFYSLQGEGFHSGRATIFIRFSGCNLWSGISTERNRALCQFCDTDFLGVDGNQGGEYDAENLANLVLSCWPKEAPPFVVLTGGEPLLQVDDSLIATLHASGCVVAVETNGTLPMPRGIDWITVSPKAITKLCITTGNELKLVYPQKDLEPSQFEGMDFDHFYLQPIDDKQNPDSVLAAVDYCLAHPRWKLSLQIHKLVGIM